jgi:hypothetical protein
MNATIETAIPDVLQLAWKVKEVRTLQSQYFASRKGRYGDKKLLAIAKVAERDLDAMVEQVLNVVET